MNAPPHLLHLFSTFAAAGPQVRTALIMNSLAGQYRHTLVALDGNLQCVQKIRPAVELQTMDPPPKSRLLGSFAMARLVRRVAPRVVLTYNWGAIEGILGARLAGVRRIIHAEDGFGIDEAYEQKRRRVLARQAVLKLASRVVVPSRLLEGILAETWRVSKARALYIANGIDIEHYSPGSSPGFRQRFDIPADAVVIGTVAKLRDVKGLDLLIESFAETTKARTRGSLAAPVPLATLAEGKTDMNVASTPDANCRPVHLVIVGDGPERESLRQLVRSLGLEDRVTFPGRISDPIDAYRAMDVFALTSLTEQMPISLVEAMACGLPIVATNVGDVQLMVAEPNQPFIAKNRDVHAFANAITQLVADPPLREALGTANRAKCCEEYSVEQMLDRYRELYETVLSSH